MPPVPARRDSAVTTISKTASPASIFCFSSASSVPSGDNPGARAPNTAISIQSSTGISVSTPCPSARYFRASTSSVTT